MFESGSGGHFIMSRMVAADNTEYSNNEYFIPLDTDIMTFDRYQTSLDTDRKYGISHFVPTELKGKVRIKEMYVIKGDEKLRDFFRLLHGVKTIYFNNQATPFPFRILRDYCQNINVDVIELLTEPWDVLEHIKQFTTHNNKQINTFNDLTNQHPFSLTYLALFYKAYLIGHNKDMNNSSLEEFFTNIINLLYTLDDTDLAMEGNSPYTPNFEDAVEEKEWIDKLYEIDYGELFFDLKHLDLLGIGREAAISYNRKNLQMVYDFVKSGSHDNIRIKELMTRLENYAERSNITLC